MWRSTYQESCVHTCGGSGCSPAMIGCQLTVANSMSAHVRTCKPPEERSTLANHMRLLQNVCGAPYRLLLPCACMISQICTHACLRYPDKRAQCPRLHTNGILCLPIEPSNAVMVSHINASCKWPGLYSHCMSLVEAPAVRHDARS